MKQFLTRTKWWVIPLVWLPVVCWSVSKSVKMGLAPYLAGLIVFLGIITWTLLEYFLHRYLFHIKTKSYWYMLPSHSLQTSIMCWIWFHKFLQGGTLFTISFMAAITSTLWMDYGLFSLRLEQHSYLWQYVHFLTAFWLNYASIPY